MASGSNDPVAKKPVDEPQSQADESLVDEQVEEQQEDLLRALEDEDAWNDSTADESVLEEPATDEPAADAGRHWPDSWVTRSAGSLVWIALAGLTVSAITSPPL